MAKDNKEESLWLQGYGILLPQDQIRFNERSL